VPEVIPVGNAPEVVKTTGQGVVKPWAAQVTTPGAAMVTVMVVVVAGPGQVEEMTSPT
jgi:hypothetical protein